MRHFTNPHVCIELEVPDEELDEVRSIVVRAMEGAASLAVPLVVGVGVAANWAEAH